MDSRTVLTKVLIPDLTPDEIKGLQDYWAIYEAHRKAITAQLIQMARGHDEFKFNLQNTSARSSTADDDPGIKWKIEDVLNYIKEQSGIHFDPRVVDVFLEQVVNT